MKFKSKNPNTESILELVADQTVWETDWKSSGLKIHYEQLMNYVYVSATSVSQKLSCPVFFSLVG
jgi:hypothetical protein